MINILSVSACVAKRRLAGWWNLPLVLDRVRLKLGKADNVAFLQGIIGDEVVEF